MSAKATDIAILYASERSRLRQFVKRLIGNRPGADDLVQDAFVNLMRSAQSTKIDSSRAYLTRTARNLAIDYLRHESMLSRYGGEAHDVEIVICDRPLPDEIVWGRQELAVLRATIDRLPTKCRVVFLLSREHGFTMKQIAKSLGIAEKTVEKHLLRAMIDCRRELRALGRKA